MVGPVGELAETTSLLRMRSRKITEGSNPSLSAIDFIPKILWFMLSSIVLVSLSLTGILDFSTLAINAKWRNLGKNIRMLFFYSQ